MFAQDYYPGGMPLTGRSLNSSDSRKSDVFSTDVITKER
jgi:hypothetical protein